MIIIIIIIIIKIIIIRRRISYTPWTNMRVSLLSLRDILQN